MNNKKKKTEQISSGTFNYLLNLGRVTSEGGETMFRLIAIDLAFMKKLTYFSTCPFGQLTKKSTCPTQSFSCPKKLIKI
jgi:hypothetical protein